MKNLIIAGMFYMIAILTTFAFNFIHTGPSVNDIERWSRLTNKETEVAQSGDWKAAFEIHSQVIQTETAKSQCLVGKAADSLRSFFYKWNLGEYEYAQNLLEQCVNNLRNSGYGNGCEARALIFLNKIKGGKVSRDVKFTFTDIFHKNGLATYIMELPWALEFKKWEAVKRRYDSINRILDSQLHTAQLESQRIQLGIKIQARQDFLEKHHEIFDPNNRPSYDSPMLEDWKSCKRIYDIFD